jgi:hypothetical protein
MHAPRSLVQSGPARPGKARIVTVVATVFGAVAVMGSVVLAGAGCQTTRFYERQKLADRCMQLDHDAPTAYIRTKAEAAREGALGGFGRSPAGGCGCE